MPQTLLSVSFIFREGSMNKIFLLEDDVSLIDGLCYSLKRNDCFPRVKRNKRQRTL